MCYDDKSYNTCLDECRTPDFGARCDSFTVGANSFWCCHNPSPGCYSNFNDAYSHCSTKQVLKHEEYEYCCAQAAVCQPDDVDCAIGAVCAPEGCTDPKTCSYTQSGCTGKDGTLHGCQWNTYTNACLVWDDDVQPVPPAPSPTPPTPNPNPTPNPDLCYDEKNYNTCLDECRTPDFGARCDSFTVGANSFWCCHNPSPGCYSNFNDAYSHCSTKQVLKHEEYEYCCAQAAVCQPDDVDCAIGAVCAPEGCTDPKTCSYTQSGCTGKDGTLHGCQWNTYTSACLVWE